MNNDLKVTMISRRYRRLMNVLFYAIPVLSGGVWLFADYYPEQLSHHSFEIVGGFTPLMKFLAFCASMIKGGVVMYGIGVLSELFGLYEKKIFFRAENVACFRKLSRALILWVAAGIIVTPLITVILTMNNPPGNHILQISLQSADVTALIIGGILRVIAEVMDDGRRLQEEIELTV